MKTFPQENPPAEYRLEQQLRFLMEAEKLKNIRRQTLLLYENRRETDAEHSFHLALMACILSEYANESIDVCKVMKMVLVHDIVEIDAGDADCYDPAANEGKEQREQLAAQRIFALLPQDQKNEYLSLWQEFEARQTPEAKFANSLDRFAPCILNYKKGGLSWQAREIRYEQTIQRNKPVKEGSEILWERLLILLNDAKAQGWLK